MLDFATSYADVATVANLIAAMIVALAGGGIVLYERFSVASRRFALLTTVLAIALACFAMGDALAGDVGLAWYQAAISIDALVGPAVYAVAVAIVRAPRTTIVRTAWLVGFGIAVWSASSPTLASSVVGMGGVGFLRPGALAGSFFAIFLLVLLLATVGELVWSYRTAQRPDDRRRALTLAAGFLIGSLGVIDFFVSPLMFAGAGVAPFAVTAGIGVIGYAAIRFRAFAPLPFFTAEQVLQVMTDGVLLCDDAGRIRNANASACALLGVSESDIVGLHAGSIFGPRAVRTGGSPLSAGDAAGFAPVLDQQIRDRELVLKRRHGDGIEVSLSSEPLRQRGRTVGSVVVFRDIRERLQAERALRATEYRYNSLFWNNPSLAYEVDRRGAIIEVNASVERMLGARAAELRGRDFGEFIHPADRPDIDDNFRRVLTGRAQEYQIRIRLPGVERELRGVSIPIFRDDEVVGVFGVAIDITEQERVRRELELQRLEFAELFEASPEAILVADENDVIVRVNPEFTVTFGYTPEQAVGRRVDELLVPEGMEADAVSLTAAARRGEIVRADTLRRRSDGTLVDVSVLARELRLPGRPPQLYGIYRDITARKRAERSLRERDEQLRHAQRLESVGKLAGGVAHDFNNLVTVINGHVGFALELLPEHHPARSDLEQIEVAGSRAANLTQQLLAFSRRQLLRPETVDATAVIADVHRMLDRLIGEHIEFETSHEGEALVRADRGQLEQLLVNLVVNARDAMPHGGRLTISTQRTLLPAAGVDSESWDVEPGEYICISVTDTGCGMDDATLARAFDPFFTTKEQGKGTGLGLATVFGIAKQSGGHVTASSRPDHGTTIRVWLPTAVAGEDGAGATAAVPPAAGRSPPTPRTGARVLVVEDEAALRDLAARVLRRAGHDVVLARDGIEALEIAAQHDIHVVVSDLVMPRMGGHELARRLRVSYPDMPIVLMSGYDDELAGGVDRNRILAKPFTPAELALRVAQALDGDAARSPPAAG